MKGEKKMINSKMLAKMLDSAEKHVFINIDGKMARISHIHKSKKRNNMSRLLRIFTTYYQR